MRLSKAMGLVCGAFLATMLGACGDSGGGFASGGGSRDKTNKKATPKPAASGRAGEQGQTPQAADTAPAAGAVGEGQSPSDSVAAMMAKVDAQSFAAFAAMPMQDFLDFTFAHASNEAIHIEAYTFLNSKDFLTTYESEIFALRDQFATVGEYLESSGISSEADVSPEAVEAGLALAESLLADGSMDSLVGGDTAASDEGLESFELYRRPKMALNFEFGSCVGSVFGLVGGVVATGFGCATAFTGIGLAVCAGGAVAVAGAASSASTNCNGAQAGSATADPSAPGGDPSQAGPGATQQQGFFLTTDLRDARKQK